MSCLMVAALIAVAIVFVVRTIAPQTVGEQLRRRLEKQLRAHYADFDISIRRGTYEPKLGFIFEDLRIEGPSGRGSAAADMLSIDRLVVLTDTQPKKLLDKQNPFVTRRVLVDGVQANTRVTDDGQLSIARLWPPPTMGPCAPRMEIRRGKLRVLSDDGDAIDLDFSDLVVINHAADKPLIAADESPITAGGSGVAADKPPIAADESPIAAGGSPIAAGGSPIAEDRATSDPRQSSYARPTHSTISLRGKSSFAKSIELQADVSAGGWQVQGAIRDARIDPDLFRRLPAAIRGRVQDARGLSCICDVTLAAKKTLAQPINFQVKTSVRQGRFSHPSLPIPIANLRGLVICRPQGITVGAAQASLGDALLRMSASIDGYGWPKPMSINLSAEGLLLSGQLASALPAKERAKWDRVQPSGRIDIVDAEITHKDGVWSTDGTIKCKGVDVRLATFPYPVGQLVGRIEISKGVATCRAMTGRVGGRRLQCGFQLPLSPKIKQEKLIVLATDGAIVIDEALVSALTPRATPTSKLERFVRSLHPRGAVHLHRATFKTDVAGNKSRSIDMDVMDSHLRYEGFPYPLYKVCGNIRVEDDLLTLAKFHGVNANAGQVLCDGSYLMPTAARDSALHLRFRAAEIPMDDALRSSLPETAQRTWDAISPSGVLDHLDVVLAKSGAAKPLQLTVTASETEAEKVTNRVLSVRPTALPYRLDITDGSVHYDGSQVVIHSLKSRHDGTRISAAGGCRRDQNGQWRFLLNIHSGSRLDPNPELIAALPEEMRGAMHRLQLRGPLSIRGRTDILLSDENHPETSIDWDVVLQLEGNRFGDVGPVHSLRGELSSRGRHNRQGLRADGFVRLDSMHINDLHVTSIRGPYAIVNDRLRLGGRLQPVAAGSTPAAPLEGRLFDGNLKLQGEVLLSSSSFDVGVLLEDGQVPTLLADLGQGRSELTGTFGGQLELEGILGTTDLLRGNGTAEVSGANLYQLPLLVQLLNLLRITPTEDVAFTDATVLYSIVEDQINFDDLKLWGDLVSLHGSGTMNWRRELDLAFNTRVSPKTTFSRLMRPLGGQRYTLWDVDVHGPISDPAVELRPLESVGQTLERIFPVIGPRDNTETNREETAGPSKWFRY